MTDERDPSASTASEQVWVVVVAAGSGRRFGSDKLTEVLEPPGRRVLDVTIETAVTVADGVVVVLRSDDPSLERSPNDGALRVAGGATRTESVRAGLAAVPDSASVILVHDGARPLASPALYERVATAVRSGAAAVVPAIAVVDTIRRRGGGVVDRDELAAVQTPQGFRADVLRAAHAGSAEATDDAGLVEALGEAVVLVEGEPENLKITRPLDLTIARALLAQRRSSSGPGGAG